MSNHTDKMPDDNYKVSAIGYTLSTDRNSMRKRGDSLSAGSDNVSNDTDYMPRSNIVSA